MLIKKRIRRAFLRVATAAIVILMLATVCSAGVYAAVVSATGSAVELSYVCDFEDNYFSSLNSKNCTYGQLTTVDEKNVLKLSITDNSENGRIVIYNSEKGDFKLKDGKTYAVTVTYKVEQIANSKGASEATLFNLVRLDSNGDAFLKIKSLTNASYTPGSTTDWVTSSAVFKAGIAGSEQYSTLALNIISPTCPDATTGSNKDQTIILIDTITVAECSGTTNGIEFITNGGSACAPVMAQSGEQIVLPKPTRDLYDFKGWYTDIDLKKEFKSTKMPNTLVTKLYAKWAPSSEAVVITFESNGGSKVGQLVGRAGDPVTLPRAERDRYLFSGWYTKDLKTSKNVTVFPEKSTTFYAKWDTIPMIYDFEDCELGVISGNDARYCNNEVTVEKDDQADGNHYLYFKNVGRNSVRLNSPDKGMAFLKAGTYTVTFKYKFATSSKKLEIGANRFVTDPIGSAAYKTVGADISNSIYTHDSSAKADKNGWYTGKFEFTIDDVSDGKTTLALRNGATAREDISSPVYIDDIVVSKKGVTYKNLLGFNSQGGSFCETEYVKIGDEVTLPTPTREGYRFIGWSYDPEGFESIESETLKIKSSYTLLYADWYKIPNESESEPEPEPEPQPEPEIETIVDDTNKDNTFMYVVIGASAVGVIIVILVIVIIKKKKK